jgi:heme exporter protein B
VTELLDLAGKEFRLEWRQRTALTGVIVYIVSTCFICYLAFREIIDVPTWNALFWIIMVFAAVNAVARSFLQESPGLQLYYYTLLHPGSVILSKVIFNTGLLCVLALIHLTCYSLFLGSLIQDMPQFLLGLMLGSAGLASSLTLVSAIAAKANGNPSLVAILSFPILIPLLLTIMRYSRNAIDGIGWAVNGSYALALTGLSAISLALGYLLFPYLWRE